MQSTKYNISEFKSAIKSSIALNQLMEKYLFDDIPNPQFYIPILDAFKTALENEEMNITIELRPIYQDFNNSLCNLLADAINLFFHLNNQSGETTKLELQSTEYYSNLLLDLKRIKKSVENIPYNILKGNINIALKLKQYFQFFFNNAIVRLENDFSIDILSSPLKDLFIEMQQNIEHSINLDEIKILNSKNQKTIIEDQTLTNNIHSNEKNRNIIEEHVEDLEEYLTEENQELLINSLNEYFSTGIILNYKMVVFKNVNIKKVGWILKKIYKEIKPRHTLSIDYLKFIKKNINLFAEYSIDENQPRESKIYKYLNQKQNK